MLSRILINLMETRPNLVNFVGDLIASLMLVAVSVMLWSWSPYVAIAFVVATVSALVYVGGQMFQTLNSPVCALFYAAYFAGLFYYWEEVSRTVAVVAGTLIVLFVGVLYRYQLSKELKIYVAR